MNSNRLKWAGAVLGAVLAAALVLGAVGLTTAAAQGEPDKAVAEVAASRPQPGDLMTTVLQPGDNLVGWIEGTTPVAELFDAVAEIETVWAWDALRRQWSAASRRVPSELHTLRTLESGMGLLVQVGGNEPVEWLRSAYPAAGLVKLHQGPNLVAWLGRDESPITYLALGIGASFEGAEIWDTVNAQHLSYAPANDGTDGERSAIRRGDAIWVGVSRTVNWLQPTGVLPRILFRDAAPQDFRAMFRADLENVLEFFASQYGIQADHSLLTVDARGDFLGASAIRSKISIGEPECRNRAQNAARASLASNCFRVLMHEYFHVLQGQLSDSAWSPLWLVEGTAVRMSRLPELSNWRHLARSVDQDSWGNVVGTLPSEPAAVEVPLAREVYTLGSIGADVIASGAGDLSIVEYWRQLAPAPTGSHFRWESRPPWQEVFWDVLGLSVGQFYRTLHDRWRQEAHAGDPRSMPPEANGETSHITSVGADGPAGRTILGTLVDADGNVIEGAIVGVDPEIFPSAKTDASGQFWFRLPERWADETAILWIEYGEDCRLYYGSTGFAESPSDASGIPLAGGVTDVSIQMPTTLLCPWFRGRIINEEKVGLSGLEVSLFHREWRTFQSPVLSGTDGSFAFRSFHRPWGWSMSIRLAGDRTGACEHNIALDRDTPVALTGEWLIEVPSNVCAGRLRGRVIDSSSATRVFDRISALHQFGGSAGDVEADGSFVLPVTPGVAYRVGVSLSTIDGGCGAWAVNGGVGTPEFDDASMILVGGDDVADVLIRVPENPCG